jgi:hypothetical protein
MLQVLWLSGAALLLLAAETVGSQAREVPRSEVSIYFS